MDRRASARLPSGRKLRWEREGAENVLREGRGRKPEQEPENTSSGKVQKKQIRRAVADEKRKESARIGQQTESGKQRKSKLRFETANEGKPIKPGRKVALSSAETVLGSAHKQVRDSNKDHNTGMQAAEFTEDIVEKSIRSEFHSGYSRKLRKYKKAERLEKKADAVKRKEMYQKSLRDNPEAASNVFSRWRQRQNIKKEYAAMKAGKSEARASYQTGSTMTSRVKKELENLTGKGVQFVRKHSHVFILIAAAALLMLVISGMLSSCALMLGGSGNAVIGTSYTAEDDDIVGAEADYRAMEEELRRQISEMQESDDYDAYELHVDEIGHNPWELASLLTVLYEDYSRGEVQRMLRQLFEAQYSLSSSVSVETVTETRTVRVGESLGTVTTSGYCNCRICCGQWSGGPTASGVYPTANHTLAVDARNPFVPMGTRVVMNGVEYVVEDTGNFARYGVQFDVYYDSHITATLHGHRQWECYLADNNGSNTVDVTTTQTQRILHITATNRSLTGVIADMDLTDEERERYQLLLRTKGNKPYLFEDDIYSNQAGDYLHYDIPGEALTDERFRRMITEAEKYLGYPYVWGGSSPSTSFDCSGFVSWVINHCGNGWNVGRSTANGLMGYCDIIRKSEARPGDLIFFQGTYDTSGASHVGIYVGGGMMIHCGNPISYASIESSYWQQHYYCMGRIR